MAGSESIFSRNINFITSDPFRASFDVQTTMLQSSLKKLLGEYYTPDTMGGTIFYAGVVMEYLGEVSIKDIGPTSIIAAANAGEIKGSSQYRVFIPELYYGTVPPTIFAKGTTIKALDESDQKEFARSKQAIQTLPKIVDFRPGDNEVLEVGDAVWVLFQNARTTENGFIYSRILSSGGSAAGMFFGAGVSSGLGGSATPAPADSSRSATTATAVELPPGAEASGKFLVDYSEIIQLMTESKGWPYRYACYPRCLNPKNASYASRSNGTGFAAFGRDYGIGADTMASLAGVWASKFSSQELYDKHASEYPSFSEAIINWRDPGKDWNNARMGLDCISYVRAAYVRLGLILPPPLKGNPEYRSPQEIEAWNYMMGSAGKGTVAPSANKIFETVTPGEQVPGDCAYTSGHALLVASYPVKELKGDEANHSVLWAANGLPKCDRDWWGGVGVNTAEKNFNSPNFFAPRFGTSKSKGKVQYSRLKKEYLPTRHFQKINDGIKAMAGNSSVILDSSGGKGLTFHGEPLVDRSWVMGDNPIWSYPFTFRQFNCKTFPKYNALQYRYPKTGKEHPDAVKSTKDYYAEQRALLKGLVRTG